MNRQPLGFLLFQLLCRSLSMVNYQLSIAVAILLRYVQPDHRRIPYPCLV